MTAPNVGAQTHAGIISAQWQSLVDENAKLRRALAKISAHGMQDYEPVPVWTRRESEIFLMGYEAGKFFAGKIAREALCQPH